MQGRIDDSRGKLYPLHSGGGFTKYPRDDGAGIDRVKTKVLFIGKEYILILILRIRKANKTESAPSFVLSVGHICGPAAGTKELLHRCF